jgi:hypothetical protein
MVIKRYNAYMSEIISCDDATVPYFRKFLARNSIIADSAKLQPENRDHTEDQVLYGMLGMVSS